MDGDLVALEIRCLANSVVDLPKTPRLDFRADLEHRRWLEAPNVTVRVENFDVVRAPTEGAHVCLDLVRRLLESDEEAPLPALDAIQEELHREQCLPAAGWAGHDVRPSGEEAAMEHLVEPRDSRANPAVRHRRPPGGGSTTVGGGGGTGGDFKRSRI